MILKSRPSFHQALSLEHASHLLPSGLMSSPMPCPRSLSPHLCPVKSHLAFKASPDHASPRKPSPNQLSPQLSPQRLNSYSLCPLPYSCNLSISRYSGSLVILSCDLVLSLQPACKLLLNRAHGSCFLIFSTAVKFPASQIRLLRRVGIQWILVDLKAR